MATVLAGIADARALNGRAADRACCRRRGAGCSPGPRRVRLPRRSVASNTRLRPLVRQTAFHRLEAALGRHERRFPAPRAAASSLAIPAASTEWRPPRACTHRFGMPMRQLRALTKRRQHLPAQRRGLGMVVPLHPGDGLLLPRGPRSGRRGAPHCPGDAVYGRSRLLRPAASATRRAPRPTSRPRRAIPRALCSRPRRGRRARPPASGPVAPRLAPAARSPAPSRPRRGARRTRPRPTDRAAFPPSRCAGPGGAPCQRGALPSAVHVGPATAKLCGTATPARRFGSALVRPRRPSRSGGPAGKRGSAHAPGSRSGFRRPAASRAARTRRTRASRAKGLPITSTPGGSTSPA